VKKTLLVIFVILLNVYSCDEQDKPVQKAVTLKTDSSEKYELPMGQVMLKKNCGPCHAWNNLVVGPALSTFNYDYLIDYYDGLIKQDSAFFRHKRIKLTRDEWKEIAIQTYGGCMPGSSTYQSKNRK
jgi:hypothetical protein